MTTTDEMLALAASAASDMGAGATGAGAMVAEATVTVTEADLTVFRAAADAGADSVVVRALLAVRSTTPAGPAAASPAASPALLPSDPAWTAWLTTAAAIAGEAALATEAAADERTARTSRPAWCAVFGAAVALAGPPVSVHPVVPVTAAIAAGLDAAAIVESGLADWDGWSSGTVAAAIGAGLTAGLLLGLTGPRLRAAVGICATQAAGLRAAEGTDAFPLQVGKAAFNGVEAALLARAGLTAPAEPLDGRRGLFALFGSAPR